MDSKCNVYAFSDMSVGMTEQLECTVTQEINPMHIDLAPVKELVSLQWRCSNNLNQVVVYANTYGGYPEEIDGLKRDYEKLWGEVAKVLRELSELVAK